ncbi:flagellar hook-basal body complex protein FlhP [Bacillaceae bacterium]
MNGSIYISAGAIGAWQQKIDTIANNVANVNTPGFKGRDLSFREELVSALDNQPRRERETGRLTPHGIRVGHGVGAGVSRLRLEQGPARETGNPYDLMLEGPGFFLLSPSLAPDVGNVNEFRLSRDGAFQLRRVTGPAGTSAFYLTNSKGEYLLDRAGQPIQVPQGTGGGVEMQVDEEGFIRFLDKETGREIRRVWIAVVAVENPSHLREAGSNRYLLGPRVLNADANETVLALIGEAEAKMNRGEIKVRQGFLEQSNVDLIKEMSDLLVSQRAYQLNARALSFSDQMLGIANSIMR